MLNPMESTTAPQKTIDVACLDERWQSVLPGEALVELEKLIQQAVHETFKVVVESVPRFQNLWTYPCELSFCLSNDAQVHQLNHHYRGKDKATNVLSFPSETQAALYSLPAHGGDKEVPLALGDVILALETIQREAAEQGKNFRDHFTHLLIHGILHLLGFDHEEDKEAEAMETLEVFILTQIGIISPYGEQFTQ